MSIGESLICCLPLSKMSVRCCRQTMLSSASVHGSILHSEKTNVLPPWHASFPTLQLHDSWEFEGRGSLALFSFDHHQNGGCGGTHSWLAPAYCCFPPLERGPGQMQPKKPSGGTLPRSWRWGPQNTHRASLHNPPDVHVLRTEPRLLP